MASRDYAESEQQADEKRRERGQGYTVAGFTLAAIMAAVVIVGFAGAVGMGVLTTGQAFFVLGAGLGVLSLAVVGLLFSMNRTLNMLRDQQATIDSLQDERIRAAATRQERTDQHQDRTDRRQEQEIDELQASASDRASPHNGGPDQERATPFGDIHPVEDVEGIGEDYGPQLEGLNIMDTEQLWQADPDAVAGSLDVPAKTVRSWQAMAEQMALDDVGQQYAELLVRADITSIDQLAGMEPDEVARAVQETEKGRGVRIQGNPISPKHTQRWIQTARDHDPTTTMRAQR